MRHLLSASLIALSSTAAAASGTCTLDNNDCVPFVACFEATGQVFRGQSTGQTKGKAVAVSPGGVECRGDWARGRDGTGRAQLLCSDFTMIRASYTYFDTSSGTAVGRGDITGGQGGKVTFWAGHNLDAYFRTVPKSEQPKSACPASRLHN